MVTGRLPWERSGHELQATLDWRPGNKLALPMQSGRRALGPTNVPCAANGVNDRS